MGRVKARRLNSTRRRSRERALGTHLFVPAEPNWQPRYNPRTALAKIGAEVARRKAQT